ncbi:MAG: cytochrome c peroxidase [Rhodopila sp.]|nr:cytochrome c peroxidase [Rhodopila sp.]
MRTVTTLLVLILLLVTAVARADMTPADPELLAKYRPPQVAAGQVDPREDHEIKLGKALFFDPILSGTSARSCASCHNPALSWGDGLPRAVADDSSSMKLRAPTLLDINQLPRLGWTGKFRDIEAVTFAAISSSGNMNLSETEALSRIAQIPGYVAAFKDVFPGQGVSRSTVEQAIAAFERTIVSGTAPFDRWVAGDSQAISPSAQQGFALFNGKAHCASCHSGWAFTDGSFHDIGTAKGDDIGRGALFPTSGKLRYAFKTPTLRDVAHRAPYMHDGSIPDLRGVLALYNEGGIDRPSRSELIRPLGLSEQDQLDLIAFLNTLTETPHPVAIPVLPR